VDGLTLALRPGETVTLLGPDGAGNSTTLDLLLGLKKPDTGTVRLFGTSPRDALVAGRVGAMRQSAWAPCGRAAG
jgi:ABC-2 type transport system ATP-binding protein